MKDFLSLAVIRADQCIGCTKCIDACPVDAIVGAAKQMHTVVIAECTGCKLCVAPCPVDCIDIITLPMITVEQRVKRAAKARKRVAARKQRLAKPEFIFTNTQLMDAENLNVKTMRLEQRKAEIAAALIRAKANNERKKTF